MTVVNMVRMNVNYVETIDARGVNYRMAVDEAGRVIGTITDTGEGFLPFAVENFRTGVKERFASLEAARGLIELVEAE